MGSIPTGPTTEDLVRVRMTPMSGYRSLPGVQRGIDATIVDAAASCDGAGPAAEWAASNRVVTDWELRRSFELA